MGLASPDPSVYSPESLAHASVTLVGERTREGERVLAWIQEAFIDQIVLVIS